MAVVRLFLAAELRRRWKRQLALAVTIGLVAAVVLALTAGARRTLSAYERFDEAKHLPDFLVQAEVDHETLEELAHEPGVEAGGTYSPLMAAPAVEGRDGNLLTPGLEFVVFAATDRTYARTIDIPLLVDGRFPDPDAADEVMIGELGARELGLGVGDEVALRSIPVEETGAFFNGDFDRITFDGPSPTVQIVGVGRTTYDLNAVAFAQRYFYATPAFVEEYGRDMIAFGELLVVQIDDDSTSAFRDAVEASVDHPSTVYVDAFDDSARSVRDATRVQGISLLLVAAAAALAALIAGSQAVGRTVASDASDATALAALGLDRTGRAAAAVGAFLPAACGAGVTAAAAAWLASGRFPTDVARDVEVHPGLRFDALIIAPGVLLVIALVLARVVLAARGALAPASTTGTGSRSYAERVGRALPATLAAGWRWAFSRRRGARLSSRVAFAGTMLGIGGLVAAVTYGAGLSHVLATPAAYGWTFDGDGGGGDDPEAVGAARDDLLANPDIGDLALAHVTGAVTIGGLQMQGFGFESVRGSIEVAVTSGRPPAGPDEIVLGTRSARALHVGIGDVVEADTVDGLPLELRVVGLGLFPTIETDRFTTGAAVVPVTFDKLTDDGYLEVVFRWAPDIDVDAAVAHLRDEIAIDRVPSPPPDLANLRLVRAYPYWLAGFLAALGIVAVGHALTAALRARRREMGVLRAIGFTRTQLTGAVVTLGASIGGVGVLLGVPLGAAAGRWVWLASAHRVGVAGGVPMPAGDMAAVAATSLVVVVLIASGAGLLAVRRRDALALRTE